MSNLPDALPGHWETAEGFEKAQEYTTKARVDLAYGDKSDLALANAVYLVDRGSLDMLPMQEAAKQRIRWLSVQLAIANEKAAEGSIYTREYARAVGAAGEILQPPGPLAGLLPLGSSILIDGPRAMAKRIEELEVANAEMLAALKEVAAVGIHDDMRQSEYERIMGLVEGAIAKAGGK